ncbi:MAG: hypothetical protein KQJ78_19295 [Deltaproteobacteria bacterium]|nr:hypothetical protein [Deltaproteobacteria bacterium]
MSEWQHIEELRALVLDLDLPRSDFAICGVMCPYCGKTDRIYKLEEPGQLDAPPPAYQAAWDRLSGQGELVLCKFCRQILAYDPQGHTMSPLEA